VRSALATTAERLPGTGPFRQGAGLAAARPTARPRLAYLPRPGSYRRWLDGRVPTAALDLPSILLARPSSVPSTAPSVVTRRVTNVGGRAMYFSSRTTGFAHQVVVTPAATRLLPGQSLTFRVHVYGAASRPLDAGSVTWTAADGSRVRIPMVITR
jgi:hypothetical protein